MTLNPMKNNPNPLTENRGMALVAVLAVVSLLLIAALELARTTGISALVSADHADRTITLERARTGLHLAMALLAEDGTGSDIDSIQEDWARPEKLALAVKSLGLDKEDLQIEIKDERGKLPVNALIKKHPGRELSTDSFKVWEKFFENFTEDPADQINALVDWLDHRDDEAVTGMSGAESDYYLSLDPSYSCGNGPFTHISELFLVKGISKDLFKVKSEEDEEESIPVSPGELITVHGIDEDSSGKTTGSYAFSPKININTAPELVIKALLPREKADLAKDIISYRIEQSDDKDFIHPLDEGWFDIIVGLSEKEKVEFNRLVRYDTDLFSVTSRATGVTSKATLSALIYRTKDQLSGKWSCRLLQVTKEK